MKKIEKKVHINAPTSKVWEVLTNPEYIEQWMMMPTDFKAEEGNNFTFEGEMDGNKFPISCTLKEIDVNKKLVFSWKMPNFEGDTKVSIELDGNGETDVTLVHTGWENLGENQDMMIEGHNAGWDQRFVEKLKEVAEK